MLVYRMKAKDVMAFNIKRLLEERNVSQTELAHAIEREVLTVHHYTKALRFPKPENLDAICKFFDIPLSELFRQPGADDISLDQAISKVADSLGYEVSKKNLPE